MTKTGLSFTAREYRGADDLVVMQQALADWIHESGGCGYDHIGDLPHRFYNGLRGRYPREEMIRLWHRNGALAGFAQANPKMGLYDARISPDFRGGNLEYEVLSWGTATLRDWMDREGAHDKPVMTDAYVCDAERRACLVELGYQSSEKPWVVLNERLLDNDLPDIILPGGFSIRSVTEADAAAVAAVHKSAFNVPWTTELYLNEVMRQPGYDPNLEHVVVAPGGSFAAFCFTWLDTINGIGQFEPVGTHKDYHRKGLGRALMTYGLKIMQQRGMRAAQVCNTTDNSAAEGLYRAMGFKSKFPKLLYRKHRA